MTEDQKMWGAVVVALISIGLFAVSALWVTAIPAKLALLMVGSLGTVVVLTYTLRFYGKDKN